MYPDKQQGDTWWSRFQTLLDTQTEWPTLYLFKFIVPKAGLDDIKQVFEGHTVTVRASTRGNYLSVTAQMEMQSSEEVISVYRAAGEVEGVVAL